MTGFLTQATNNLESGILDVNLIIWNRWNHEYRYGNLYSYKREIFGSFTNCIEFGKILRNYDNSWTLNVDIKESELGVVGVVSKYAPNLM